MSRLTYTRPSAEITYFLNADGTYKTFRSLEKAYEHRSVGNNFFFCRALGSVRYLASEGYTLLNGKWSKVGVHV